MEITASQAAILARLQASLLSAKVARAVYCSEWLGYLPFGAYHWVEIDGVDVSAGFGPGWSESDLESLVQAGFLCRESEWRSAEGEFDYKITYSLRL